MLKGRKEAPLELCKHLMLKTNSGCKVHCRHGARKAMTLARIEGQKSRSGSQKGQTEDKWLRGFSAPAGWCPGRAASMLGSLWTVGYGMGQAVVSEQDGAGRSWQTSSGRGVVCACRYSGSFLWYYRPFMGTACVQVGP